MMAEGHESKGISSFNGMESGNGGESKEEFVVAKSCNNNNNNSTCDLVLRVMALVLTLGATLVAGMNKQTKAIPFKLSDAMPPIDVPVTAKWHYMSAYIYFVVANAIASAYAAVSLLIALTSRGKIKAFGTLVTMVDALMVALLFSGVGAASAVGVLGFQGNSHVRWEKVCNVFGKFCDQAAASVIISLIGSMAFLLLMVLQASRLHRRT